MVKKEDLIPLLNPLNQLIGYGFWFREHGKFLFRTEIFTPGVTLASFRTEAMHFNKHHGLNYLESVLNFQATFNRLENGLAVFEISDPHVQETLHEHYEEWKG